MTKKSIKLQPPYFPFTQQRLCCVACAIQWILYRRGLTMIDQETIANEIDFVIPKKYVPLFNKVKTLKRKPKEGWGTREKDGSLMNAFFKKFDIPLQVRRVLYSDIDDPATLIETHLKAGDDIMLIPYMTVIDPTKKFGHALLVSELIPGTKPRLVVGDPDFFSKKFYEVDLKNTIKGMSAAIGKVERGLYIFTNKST